MDLLIARDWAAALRSGKYQQGRHALRKGDSFCCLGVLCELAVERGIIPPSRREVTSGELHVYGDHDAAVLPTAVCEWADMTHAIGTIAGIIPELEEADSALSEINDAGKPFSEIAALIERYADRM